MRTHSTGAARAALLLAGSLASITASAQAVHPSFGRAATAGEVTAVDVDIRPNGAGLPAGSGTVQQGQAVYESKCAACHGATGVEGPRDRLVGGQGTLATAKPIKTIGSYWQYAPTLYDYVARAMPFTAPGSLKPDEVYGIVAYLLNRNGVIAAAQVMDAKTLPLVKMPNRDGFVVEPAFRNVKRK
jgi:S-disulfanyl-L-cysteine oxidoreductase SoxD